jgi:hypothetical protein
VGKQQAKDFLVQTIIPKNRLRKNLKQTNTKLSKNFPKGSFWSRQRCSQKKTTKTSLFPGNQPGWSDRLGLSSSKPKSIRAVRPRPWGGYVAEPSELFRLKCANDHYAALIISTHFKRNNLLVCRVSARYNHGSTGSKQAYLAQTRVYNHRTAHQLLIYRYPNIITNQI